MDKPGYWWLFSSVFVVGIMALIGYIIVKKKAKKMRREYYKELEEAEALKNEIIYGSKNEQTGKESALSRKNLGELLWDFDDELIKQKIRHLAFIDMEFLINTIFRNKYKSFLQMNSVCGYELISIASKKKDIDLYYDNIKNVEMMNKYCDRYKISTSRLNKVNMSMSNIDLILILEFKKDIVDAVQKSYKLLSPGGIIFIAGLQNRKFKRRIKELKKYLKLVGYRFEENTSAKNIMLIAK